MVGRSKKGAAWGWRRMALGAACVAGLAVAAYVGRSFLPRASAQPAAPARPTVTQPAAPAPPSDYATRPVAFLNGTEAVTREQLGEYLIARYGAEKLPLLLNKMIIDEACKAKGIDATPAEVEAAFAADLDGMKVDQKTFVDGILKQYKKTLYEWKEDVVRPKLLMSKLVRDRVRVTEDDIKAGYEAYHGEKVDCQIIYWPKSEREVAMRVYGEIRASAEEFDRQAKQQANSRLAATGGHVVPPMGRHTTGCDELERAAFALQPKEMSALIDTPEGIAVVKCIQHIPADTTVSLESVRATLYKEVFDKKLQMEIPKAFIELQRQANVKQLLADPGKPVDLRETTQQTLNDGIGPNPVKDVTPPAANAH